MLARLQSVFREVFDDESLSIERGTSASDIPEWDSLMHVTLIVNVEREFGVRFASSEIAGLQNVGELLDLIQRKSK